VPKEEKVPKSKRRSEAPKEEKHQSPKEEEAVIKNSKAPVIAQNVIFTLQ